MTRAKDEIGTDSMEAVVDFQRTRHGLVRFHSRRAVGSFGLTMRQHRPSVT
jgi:hypothetical protein